MADGTACRNEETRYPKQNHFFFSIFDADSVGIAIFDSETHLIVENRAFASMLNGDPGIRRVGKTIREFLGDPGATLENAIKRVWTTGTNVSNLVKVSPDKPDTSWIFNFTPLRGATGSVVRVIGIVVQTDRREKVDQSLTILREDVSWLRKHIGGAKFGNDNAQVCERDAETVPLAPQESKILVLLASCKSNKEIAAQLGISPATVATYRSRLSLKLNLHSVGEIVHYAIRHRLIDP